MALTPQNNAEILREVDDELRRDQVVRLWRRWGVVAIGLAVASLVALGSWLWWRSAREATIGLEGEQMASAVAKLEGGNTRGAEAQLKALTTSKAEGYRVAARIALADNLLAKADTKEAAAAYATIAADTSIAQPFRDLALVRQTAAEYETLTPGQVVARLKPLAIAGAQFQAEFFFLARAVGWVRKVCRFVFHMINGAVDFLHQVLFPLLQNLGEVLAHGLAHVLFALLFNVGFETAKLTILLLGLCGHEMDRLSFF